MNRIFKLQTGEVVDPIAYSKQVIEEQSKLGDVRVYVGCDSQNRRWNTVYAGVIAYRYGARGTHYIFTKMQVEKIKDRWPRLSKEVQLSIEIANHLQENGIPVYCIDFDFNSEDLAKSNDMVTWAQGWAVNLGYNCTVKPDEQVASRAADHLVKGNRPTRRRRKSGYSLKRAS